MGWDDCFDFSRNVFTQPETKISEIHRVLKHGGKFVCCSWQAQEDLAWMETAILRYFPEILNDEDYLQQRPVGMSYEKAHGYEVILQSADFREVEIFVETAEFISTDEEEWWRQMERIGWDIYFKKLKKSDTSSFLSIKQRILYDLSSHKQSDGIHFTKTVFYISGVKL